MNRPPVESSFALLDKTWPYKQVSTAPPKAQGYAAAGPPSPGLGSHFVAFPALVVLKAARMDEQAWRIASFVLMIDLGLAAGTLAACSGQDEQDQQQQPGRSVYDTSAIDVTGFPGNDAVRGRVLRMPFGEAAARLGSLRFEAKSHFIFSRGGEDYEQHDVYRLAEDSRGNFHVDLDTPGGRLEVYMIGDAIYIRQDRGRLRSKHQHSVETERWTETAWSSHQQTLELFGARLHIIDPRPENVAGRQATRFRLVLAPEAPPVDGTAGAVTRSAPLPQTSLPVAPPARWREQAKALDLKGHLSLDAATGVILATKIEGRLEIADRDVRPTELTIRYESLISEIGKVAQVKAPKRAVPEFQRSKPKGDVLGFFRDQLAADSKNSQ